MTFQTDRSASALPALVLLAMLLGGCVSVAERVSEHLLNESSKRDGTAVLIAGDLAAFRGCLRHRGGSCQGDASTPLPQSTAQDAVAPVAPALGESTTAALAELAADHPARRASAVLAHPLLQKAADLHNQIRGLDDAGGAVTVDREDGSRTVTLDTSIGEVRDLLNQVHGATLAHGFGALATVTAAATKNAPADARTAKDHRTAVYVRDYLEAYFENGHFVEVDLTIDPAQAERDLADALCGQTSPAASVCRGEASKLYASLLGQDTGKTLVTAGTTGFVSRAGTFQAQFPGFRVDIDPTASHLITASYLGNQASPDQQYLTVGLQLLRIVLEGVFDAHEGLPATDPSATGLAIEGIGLPAFVPGQGNVDAADLGKILKADNRVEAAAGVLIDRIIRGIGPINLDNQAIEQAVVTLVATTVRKAAEKATWCWYACGLDAAVDQAEDEAKSDLKKDLEQVKLRLRLR